MSVSFVFSHVLLADISIVTQFGNGSKIRVR